MNRTIRCQIFTSTTEICFIICCIWYAQFIYANRSVTDRQWETTARWLSWLKRLTSNEEIPSSNLGRAFFRFIFSWWRMILMLVEELQALKDFFIFWCYWVFPNLSSSRPRSISRLSLLAVSRCAMEATTT